MRSRTSRRITTSVAAFALVVLAGGAAVPAMGAAKSAGGSSPTIRPACSAAARPGQARCFALVNTGVRQGTHPAGPPAGFGAGDLESAYNLPVSQGADQVVAVVDAFDDPTAETDLAKYRSTYGLPACTTANGCFQKLNQNGDAGSYPKKDIGWAVEISLDVDMVSAACPKCHIVLVEARSNSFKNLGLAVATAAGLGPSAISNSYGTDEFAGMKAYAHFYQQPSTTVLASSGDFGFGPAQFPAVTPGVLAVGGTSLYTADNKRGWLEQAWSGAGSGCSAYIAKPAYQLDKHCSMRTVADTSAVADPNTGVAMYDTTKNPYGVPPGWLVIGGTSVASPLVAGVVGLAGNGHTFTTGYLYKHASSLYDAVGGANGFCGGDYLCTGKRGYDGPTGLGTPNGTGAF